MTETRIRKAASTDFNTIASLLQASSLPIVGVAEHLDHFLVAEKGNEIVGAIGLEMYGETALLRSAVVRAELQNAGIGTQLYARLIEHAQSLNVRRMILLTTTAEKYFERKGWTAIDAKSVSGQITRSAEFTGACPSTAVCMELRL